MTIYIQSLPSDIIDLIVSKLDSVSVLRLHATCHGFCNPIIKNHAFYRVVEFDSCSFLSFNDIATKVAKELVCEEPFQSAKSALYYGNSTNSSENYFVKFIRTQWGMQYTYHMMLYKDRDIVAHITPEHNYYRTCFGLPNMKVEKNTDMDLPCNLIYIGVYVLAKIYGIAQVTMYTKGLSENWFIKVLESCNSTGNDKIYKDVIDSYI